MNDSLDERECEVDRETNETISRHTCFHNQMQRCLWGVQESNMRDKARMGWSGWEC